MRGFVRTKKKNYNVTNVTNFILYGDNQTSLRTINEADELVLKQNIDLFGRKPYVAFRFIIIISLDVGHDQMEDSLQSRLSPKRQPYIRHISFQTTWRISVFDELMHHTDENDG